MKLWAGIVRRASLERQPLGFGMQPPRDSDLEQFVRAEVTALVDVLSEGCEERPAWTWWGDSTARWIPRLFAYETMVHRWDATNALGEPASIAPALAADGVVEFFDVFMPYTGHPPQSLAGSFALEAADVGIRWLVHVGTSTLPTITATDAIGGARASVRGSAEELLLLLWRRLPPEALISSPATATLSEASSSIQTWTDTKWVSSHRRRRVREEAATADCGLSV
jgi:hypothetical protein